MTVAGPYEIEHKYLGLSTDTKPVGKVGDKFFETDTGLWFVYSGSAWVSWIAPSGVIAQKFVEATSGALSGASGTIVLGIAAGSRILSVQLRVDTAITSAAATTWTAAFTNTPTTAICSGKAFTKNTKYSALLAVYELTTGTAAITITPNTGTFTGGVVRAVVQYEGTRDLGSI